MCGRFSLTLPIQDLLKYLDATAGEISEPRYNIAPTQQVLILREGIEGGRELAGVRWGLVPSWSMEMPSGAPLINARCETLATKPSFREAFRHRRCLVPASGFYEWKKEGKRRLPYHITYRDRRPMLLAGIWERWRNPAESDQVVDSCAIVTTEACPEVRPLHDRMPVLISDSACDLWLHGDPDQTTELMAPYQGEDLVLTPANPVMNSGEVEGAECLQGELGGLF